MCGGFFEFSRNVWCLGSVLLLCVLECCFCVPFYFRGCLLFSIFVIVLGFFCEAFVPNDVCC